MMVNTRNYSDEYINRSLRAADGSRRVSFRYDLLSKEDIKLGELDGIESANVSYGEFCAIKRTATFVLNEYFPRKEINFLTDRIQPWFILHMPDGGTVEWPLGIFLLCTPDLEVTAIQRRRNIGAYDKTLILEEYKFPHRQYFGKGTNYVAAIGQVLGMAGLEKINITASDYEFLTDKEFPIGTSAKEAVNELLNAINYDSLSIDATGYARSQPYILPSERKPTICYSTEKDSIIALELVDSLDLAGRANVFVRVAENIEEGTSYTSTFVNDNPQSPLSTVRRGRRIMNFAEVENAASQEALDALTYRAAVEATSAYRHFTFKTLNMPMHGSAETLFLEVPSMFDTPMKFSETDWEMDSRYDGEMSHKARAMVIL